ncbi:conserved hypothetical protein [Carnobacterium maltaromaticum]|nr:conserved hypothetical protein [Carnobacterium maltaromaticum]
MLFFDYIGIIKSNERKMNLTKKIADKGYVKNNYKSQFDN